MVSVAWESICVAFMTFKPNEPQRAAYKRDREPTTETIAVLGHKSSLGRVWNNLDGVEVGSAEMYSSEASMRQSTFDLP